MQVAEVAGIDLRHPDGGELEQRAELGLTLVQSGFIATLFNAMGGVLGVFVGMFATRLDTIPAAIPYLAAEPSLVASWKATLGEGGFKIGVAWRSSARGAAIGKTFSPSYFAALSKIPGVRLISLQKADENAELDSLPPGPSPF